MGAYGMAHAARAGWAAALGAPGSYRSSWRAKRDGQHPRPAGLDPGRGEDAGVGLLAL